MSFCRRRPPTDSLGQAIRGLRERLDLSQTELGAKLGCPPNTISQYELGITRPSVSRLLSLLREAEGNERATILEALERNGLSVSDLSPALISTSSTAAIPTETQGDTPNE